MDQGAFQISLELQEAPDILSNLFFTSNPTHWQRNTFSASDIGMQSETLTIKDQFTRVQVRLDQFADRQEYSGAVYDGIETLNQQCIPSALAEKFFKRVSNQKEIFSAYASNDSVDKKLNR